MQHSPLGSGFEDFPVNAYEACTPHDRGDKEQQVLCGKKSRNPLFLFKDGIPWSSDVFRRLQQTYWKELTTARSQGSYSGTPQRAVECTIRVVKDVDARHMQSARQKYIIEHHPEHSRTLFHSAMALTSSRALKLLINTSGN